MAGVALNDIVRRAEALGFALAGVARALPAARADAARRWIAEGQHGEMRYLAEHLDTRLDPAKLMPGVCSIIAVADAYAQPEPGDSGTQTPGAGPGDPARPAPGAHARGRVARYAWGRDYHKVIKSRLHALCDALAEEHPGHRFRSTVDTAPVLEREHAARAGLGWTGKHTLLIHPRHGSFFLLGVVLTTLPIQTSQAAHYPGPLLPPDDHCANCTRCIDACPTGAIAASGYALDARRCISYLTIEHRGAIDPGLHAGMGRWIAGCDICQEVCPYNEAAKRHPLPVVDAYAPRGHAPALDLAEVLRWTEADRRRVFSGTALTRIKLPMLKRNALIAAGNQLRASADPTLRSAVCACLDDDEPLVRQTAREVLAALPAPAPPDAPAAQA